MKRCPLCDWPIVPEPGHGCWEGNCAARPLTGSSLWFSIQTRRLDPSLYTVRVATRTRPRALPLDSCDD